MKLLWPLILISFLFVGCSQKNYSQYKESDDLYFSRSDRQTTVVSQQSLKTINPEYIERYQATDAEVENVSYSTTKSVDFYDRDQIIYQTYYPNYSWYQNNMNYYYGWNYDPYLWSFGVSFNMYRPHWSWRYYRTRYPYYTWNHWNHYPSYWNSWYYPWDHYVYSPYWGYNSYSNYTTVHSNAYYLNQQTESRKVNYQPRKSRSTVVPNTNKTSTRYDYSRTTRSVNTDNIRIPTTTKKSSSRISNSSIINNKPDRTRSYQRSSYDSRSNTNYSRSRSNSSYKSSNNYQGSRSNSSSYSTPSRSRSSSYSTPSRSSSSGSRSSSGASSTGRSSSGSRGSRQ
jgi:hypothetical protein